MSLKLGFGSIIARMVIDRNETQLKTVAQLRTFFNGTLAVEFQPIGEDSLCYEHIAAVHQGASYIWWRDYGLV